jgi:Calcineurin-like phosphoesterase
MAMTPLQSEVLILWRKNKENVSKTARQMNRGRTSIRELLAKALQWEAAQDSPGQLAALETTGIDVGIGRHGWRVIVDKETGSRDSVFWVAANPQILPESFIDAMKDALKDLQALKPIPKPTACNKDLCNFIPLADLHIGGQYGDPDYLKEIERCTYELMGSLPRATKAVIVELGDLLDANDHKGITPASGNNCDVIRENTLKNSQDAVEIMGRFIVLALKTHEEVEVHLLRGNHDETAYIAVMMTLAAYFKDNKRVNIVVTDDDFRVIPWGLCAVFPNHGDKCKWEDLKNVFSDQFPSAWATAKYWRFVWTAHFHHDRQRDIMGVFAEHFRTLSAPNKWARQKALFARGGIQCVTLHKEDGEKHRTKVNLRPLLLQDRKI